MHLTLEYDGAGFEGWQRQGSARTVQGVVEEALARVLGSAHAVVGAGRTDAGAHARAMAASFRTSSALPTPELERALDAVLPPDVGVRSLREAPEGFHARRDARWKWYRYRIVASRRKRPLLEARATRLRAVPPLAALEAAADPLRGRHDFRSFANAGSPRERFTRTLHAIRWSRRGDVLRLDVLGDGFLYKMVRTLVGTMIRAARTADPAGSVRRALEARDRRAAGAAVPARGLTLMAVGFPGDPAPSDVPFSLRRAVESATHGPPGGRS
jgi:tRNA pseudouridine38-40 synthase